MYFYNDSTNNRSQKSFIDGPKEMEFESLVPFRIPLSFS